MKDEARERSTVNLRAEADGHESAILSPAQDAGLRVPAPLSALGVEVCAAEGDEGGLPPADPTRPSPCQSLGRGPPGTSGTGKTSGLGTASAGW